jgi:hypothetical protein
MRFEFCLLKNKYALTIRHNYCGAIATRRVPRDGETWLRGNDLRDWRLYRLPLVLWDVLAYEFSFGRWGGGSRCCVSGGPSNAQPPSA